MTRRLPLALAAAGILLAVPGTAHANRNTADADCSGLTFSMPRTEDGTTITITRNGTTVYSVRNDVFGQAYNLSFPSPDRTVPQTWRTVVAGYNGTLTWSETVPACDTPTTTTTVVSTSTTTTTPSPSSSVSVDTTSAPTTSPSSSVPTITTPRPTTTTVPTTPLLPETGQDMSLPVILAALASGTGAALLMVRRKGAVK